MTKYPRIAIIGLGEVGSVFAAALVEQGVPLAVGSRPSQKSMASAARLGLALDHDLARVARGADVVLLTTTGEGLRDVVATVAPALAPHALLADLTAAATAQVVVAADSLGAARARYVDVAIMGAASLHGLEVPLLASGPSASGLAEILNPLGFRVSARTASAVGDASRLKLLRSLFAKGLDAVVVESMVAAEALGLRGALVDLLADFDQRPLRDHIEMYLRTHPVHAARRLVEMELAEAELLELRLPSLTTRATIDRYRRTVESSSRLDLPTGALDADTAARWLLEAEKRA